MLRAMIKPMPPAPIMPKMAHSEKFISKRMAIHATSCESAAGSTALKNTPILPTPVASSASIVSCGMLSKLCAKARVKNAVVCTHKPAIPAAGPMPRHTIIKSTHTGVGTARKKVNHDCTSTDSQRIRKIFSAANMPKNKPKITLYNVESTVMESVSHIAAAIKSIYLKSNCARR